MTMSNTKKAKIGQSKATFIPKGYDWGLYFWRLPDGHLFHDGEGNLLNIPAMKHDLSKIAELRKAAAHHGQPEGEPWFYSGIKRATDEQLSEQKERLKAGLLPNLDDLGAVHAAQQSLSQYGDQG
jgi:hypothetical protein